MILTHLRMRERRDLASDAQHAVKKRNICGRTTLSTSRSITSSVSIAVSQHYDRLHDDCRMKNGDRSFSGPLVINYLKFYDVFLLFSKKDEA